MIEKLKAYRAELEQEKLILESTPIDVEADVIAYREKRLAEEEAKKAKSVAKLNSDIDCINGLIDREEVNAVEQELSEITQPGLCVKNEEECIAPITNNLNNVVIR